MNVDLNFKYKNTLEFIERNAPFEPEVAIVLGSGLGDFAESLNKIKTLPTEEIPGYPLSTVAGHKGFIHFAEYSGKKALVFQGRIHFYEGYSVSDVILPTLIAQKLNSTILLLTNAAGGINRKLKPGDLMINVDFYSFFIKKELSLLLGQVDVEIKNRFLKFPAPNVIKKIKEAADWLSLEIKEGSYWYTKGPSYETPAEIRMMKKFGADAVGMSTAHEAIVANYLGMDVGAISLITNYAAGISQTKLNHEEVIEAGKLAEKKFSSLLLEFLKRA